MSITFPNFLVTYFAKVPALGKVTTDIVVLPEFKDQISIPANSSI